MVTSTEAIAGAYCVAIAAASMVGGWIPLFFRLTHTGMQVALSFVAGVMLGIGLLHLLPHGYWELHDISRTVWWVLLGFLVMFFLERFFHFHHHDAPAEAAVELSDHGHAHGHDHDRSPQAPEFGWAGAFLGLTLHSLIDGVALAAATTTHGSVGWAPAGFGVFLAVFLHKPFDSLSIGTLMSAGGWSRGWRHAINTIYALVAPLGVLLFFLGADRLGEHHDVFLGCALCLAAGAFLCIATSDLLPELQFHSHDRLKLSAALLLGVALAWVIVRVEETQHHHDENGHTHHVHP